jgi:hypothetical protein
MSSEDPVDFEPKDSGRTKMGREGGSAFFRLKADWHLPASAQKSTLPRDTHDWQPAQTGIDEPD